MPKVSDAHRDARRDEIIAAAIRAFTAKGFARASMADIVTASGLSVGAVYGHFAGKRELLAAVAHHLLARRSDEIETVLRAGPPPSPGEALALMVGNMVRDVEPRALIQVWAEATVDPEIRGLVHGAVQTVRGLMGRALRAWFTAHPDRAGDVDVEVARLLPVMTGLATGLVLQRAILPDFDVDGYLATVRELLPH